MIEYGVMSSKKSSNIKDILNTLELIEDIDYRLQDILQPVKHGGYSHKNNNNLFKP